MTCLSLTAWKWQNQDQNWSLAGSRTFLLTTRVYSPLAGPAVS